MRRLLLPLFGILGLLASCLIAGVPTPAPAQQQTGNLVQASFTFTAAGQTSPILQLTGGQGNCSVVVDNIGGGATLVPQATSDINPSLSSQWNSATNIHSGSINAAGTFTGSVSSPTNGGLSGFSVTITALTSGTISGKISCSNATGAITATLSGGSVTAVVSPVPLPVVLPTCGADALPCVRVSGLVAVTTPPPVVFPSTGPTDAAGLPYVHPTSQPTCGVALPCVQVSLPPTPIPYASNAAGQINTAHVLDSTGLPIIPQICDKTATSGTIVTATTTAILAVSGSNKYFVCGYHVVNVGANSANTVQIVYGTGATCGTGTTNISALMGVATSVSALGAGNVPVVYPYAIASTPASGAVCAVTTGTTTNLAVWVLYAIHA